MATNLGTAYVSIMPSMKGFGPKVSKALGGIDTATPGAKAGGMFSSAFTRKLDGSKAGAHYGATFSKGLSIGGAAIAGAVGGAAASALGMVMSTVSSSLGSAIHRVDTIANFPKVMANMGIDADAAQRSIDAVKEGIDGLPTSLDSAVSSVQRFTSANSDIERSTKYFLAMNDAILAGGAPAEMQASAIEQLSQAYAKGKFDSMEWRNLQQTMPAQLNQIASAFGMTSEELYESIKSGETSMDDFMEKMVELDENGGENFASFAEQAKTSTGGIATALTNVQNRISKAIASVVDAIGQTNISGVINNISSHFADVANFVIEIIEAMKSHIDFEAVNAGIEAMGAVFASAEPSIHAFAELVGTRLGYAINMLAEALPVVAESIGQVWSSFAGAVDLNAVADAFGAILQAAIDLAPYLGEVAAVMAGGLGEAITAIATAVPAIVDEFRYIGETLAPIIPSFDQIGEAVRNIGNAWSVAAEPISNFMAVISEFDTSFMEGMIKAFGETLAPELEHFGGTLETLGTSFGKLAIALTPVMEALQPFVSLLGESFVDCIEIAVAALDLSVQSVSLFADSLADLIYTIEEAVDGVVTFFEELPETLQAIWDTIVSAAESVPKSITGAFTGIGGNVSAKFSGMSGTIGGYFNSIKSAASGVPGAIKSKFENIGSTIGEKFAPLKSKVSSVFSDAKSLVSSAMSSIKSTISGTGLSFPHINLPHFSVYGGTPPYGIGGKGSLPSFSVSWYAQGAWFKPNNPIVMAGFGDNKKYDEVALPLSPSNLAKVGAGIAAATSFGGGDVYNITANGAPDPREQAREIRRELHAYNLLHRR